MSKKNIFALKYGVCEYFNIPRNIPYKDLSDNDKYILLFGSDGIKTPINIQTDLEIQNMEKLSRSNPIV